MCGDFTTENSLSDLPVPRELIVEVVGNVGIDDGNPFPNLTRIVGNLSLRTNRAEAPRVESVTGLALVMGRATSLRFVDGSVIVGRNAVLDQLARVGDDLTLHDGASVPALVTVGKDVMISGDVLAPRLTFVGGEIDIENMSWNDRERSINEVLPALKAESMGQYQALMAGTEFHALHQAVEDASEALRGQPDPVWGLSL